MTASFPANHPHSRIQEAQAELKRRLRAGENFRVEAVLASYPDLAADTECALDLIYDEFETREEIGQQPDPEEYTTRFPQWQKDLRRLFTVHRETQEEAPAVLTLFPDGPDSSEACYQVMQAVSDGPMGRVYKALDVRRKRVVAVKVFSGRHVADALRFRSGAQEQAGLQHPHILPVYEIGISEEGLPCFTMEFAEGGSLEKRSAGKPLPADECARLVQTLAEAMSYAHAQAVVHRDLKPANVVQTADGTYKITDFGLAKKLEGPVGQTADGDVLGTPSFMAPEQAAGRIQDIDARTDVYGLGAILYHLLTGRPPYRGRTVLETLHQVLLHDLEWPRKINPRCDRRLESICLKCLEKSRERRYSSARELGDDLSRWLRHEPVRAHRHLAQLGRMARHRVRHTAAGLLLSLVLLMGVALSILIRPAGGPSPDQIAQQQEREQRQFIQSELVAGREVMLIGAPGERIAFAGIEKPLDFRWDVRHHTTTASEAEDKAFSIHSFGNGFLELLDEPIARPYRFSAEVRHDRDSFNPESEAGLYFAHHKAQTNQGLCHLCCKVGFNDIVDFVRDVPDLNSKGNPLILSVHLCTETGEPYHFRILAMQTFRYTPPSLPADRLWRPITVESTADEVRVFWGNDLVLRCKHAEILKAAQELLRMQKIDGPVAAELSTGLLDRGGLGLYVHNGTASYRFARVELFGADRR